MWPVPAVKELKMMRMSQIKWKRTVSRKPIASTISPDIALSDDDIAELIRKLELNGCHTALAKIIEPFSSNYATDQEEEPPVKTIRVDKESSSSPNNLIDASDRDNITAKISKYFLTDMYDKKNEDLGLEQLQEISRNFDLTIPDNIITMIMWTTKDQSSSKNWLKKLRAGRITASVFKSCCTTNPKKPAKSLVRKICHPEKCTFSSKATNYGSSFEKEALNDFMLEKSSHHINFQVKNCGLILSNDYPGLGASPDGLVSCDCHEDAVLEIKCPYTWKDESDLSILLNMKAPFLICDEQNEITLNPKHQYFYQVQMQMYLSKRKLAYFVVWTKQKFLEIKVEADSGFWEKNSKKALNFHKLVIFPELLGNMFLK